MCNPVWLCQTFGMPSWVWTPKPDTPLQDSLYQKYPLFNKLQPYENTVNYKRKSRRRFFLLMRSRTAPISSEFRGGGLTPQTPPRYATGQRHGSPFLTSGRIQPTALRCWCGMGSRRTRGKKVNSKKHYCRSVLKLTASNLSSSCPWLACRYRHCNEPLCPLNS